MIAGLIVTYLKDNKEEIVDEINKKINLPLISEAKEEEIISSLFDGLMEILEGILSKKK
jgi:nucleoid DNA-binding protein|tara:strand:+ start:303 stop:479 length:177 start_codon:yes stop_codon:yes gene_type:complete